MSSEKKPFRADKKPSGAEQKETVKKGHAKLRYIH